MNLELKEAKETELSIERHKSIYRETLNKFLASNLSIAKIVCVNRARANSIAHQLQDWKQEEDKILIFRRGNIVYLKKE